MYYDFVLKITERIASSINLNIPADLGNWNIIFNHESDKVPVGYTDPPFAWVENSTIMNLNPMLAKEKPEKQKNVIAHEIGHFLGHRDAYAAGTFAALHPEWAKAYPGWKGNLMANSGDGNAVDARNVEEIVATNPRPLDPLWVLIKEQNGGSAWNVGLNRWYQPVQRW